MRTTKGSAKPSAQMRGREIGQASSTLTPAEFVRKANIPADCRKSLESMVASLPSRVRRQALLIKLLEHAHNVRAWRAEVQGRAAFWSRLRKLERSLKHLSRALTGFDPAEWRRARAVLFPELARGFSTPAREDPGILQSLMTDAKTAQDEIAAVLSIRERYLTPGHPEEAHRAIYAGGILTVLEGLGVPRNKKRPFLRVMLIAGGFYAPVDVDRVVGKANRARKEGLLLDPHWAARTPTEKRSKT